MKIRKPLSFILKQGLTEFDIEFKNGVYVLTANGFKQNLKRSEHDKIVAEQVKSKTRISGEEF